MQSASCGHVNVEHTYIHVYVYTVGVSRASARHINVDVDNTIHHRNGSLVRMCVYTHIHAYIPCLMVMKQQCRFFFLIHGGIFTE